jgi:hypothetical protein
MHVSVSEIRERFGNFSEKKWDDINRRLTLFFNKYWRGVPGLEAEDFINSAILAVYEGRRRWPERISLMEMLCGVIRSEVAHILKQRKRQQTQSIEVTADKALTTKGDGYAHRQLCDQLLDLVRGHPILVRMVKFFIKDPETKRRDYLALLPDVPKRDLYNEYRQLNKLLGELKLEPKKEQENGKVPRKSNQARGHRGAGKPGRVSRRVVRNHGPHDPHGD